MPPAALSDLMKRYRRKGHRGLTEKECCALVLRQLAAIAKWEKAVYDTIWGGGGGGSPPPPPSWPPK